MKERVDKLELGNVSPIVAAEIVSEQGVANATAQAASMVLRSEEIKEGSKSALAVPIRDIDSQDSTFRANAPKVEVIELETMQS